MQRDQVISIADRKQKIDQNLDGANKMLKDMERSVYIRILLMYLAIILLGVAILMVLINRLMSNFL